MVETGLVGFGSPLVVTLWIAAIMVAVAWFIREHSRHRLLTIPSYVVLLWMFVPILLQYPFTYSPLNAVVATGLMAFETYVPVLDRTFLICLVGMLSFMAGFAIKSRRAAFAPHQHLVLGLQAWSSGPLLWLTGYALLALFLLLLLAGVAGSSGMRSAAMTTPALRPFFNLAMTLLPTIIGLVLLVAVEKRDIALGVLLLLLLLLAAITGSRGAAFGGVATYVATVLTYRSLQSRLMTRHVLVMIPIAILMLLLILYLGDLRAGQYNPLVTAARFGSLLFYGNNFSDLRDFAWVLSYWDGSYFWGRSQLAGLLGFIPSAILPFRSTWGWGHMSLEITGISVPGEITVHPGLRPSIFGEPYFNFGLPGVILAGVLLGYTIRRLHEATIAAVRGRSGLDAKMHIYAAYVALTLVFAFLNTSGFFALYVTLGMLNAARVVKYLLRVAAATGGRGARSASLQGADAGA